MKIATWFGIFSAVLAAMLVRDICGFALTVANDPIRVVDIDRSTSAQGWKELSGYLQMGYRVVYVDNSHDYTTSVWIERR